MRPPQENTQKIKEYRVSGFPGQTQGCSHKDGDMYDVIAGDVEVMTESGLLELEPGNLTPSARSTIVEKRKMKRAGQLGEITAEGEQERA